MAPAPLPAEVELALRRFRTFYAELFTIKRLLHDGDWDTLLGQRRAIGTTGTLEERVMLAVRQRLRDAITAQGFGGLPASEAPWGVDVGYVWTAVADAALLHNEAWPGREGWIAAPLETILYRTRVAGDRVFQAADDLLKRRQPDPQGLAMTILLALSVGFRGRYFGHDDNGRIDKLKSQLFGQIFHNTGHQLDDFDNLTTGGTQALDQSNMAQLPSIRPWVRAILILAVVYIIASRLLWWHEVSPLSTAATQAADALSLAR